MSEVAQTTGTEIAALVADGQAFVALGLATRDLLELGENFETLVNLATIEGVLGFFQRARRS
jgi:hypothetical protein